MKVHLLALLAMLGAAVSAPAAEHIRVVVADDQQAVTLRSQAGLTADGVPGDRRLHFTPSSVGTRPVSVGSAGTFVQMNGRSYRGTIELRKKRNGLLLVINDIDIEDYLRGVVASEVPHDWEPEVLKAQAVASRTYALYQKRAAGRRPYHILATVDSQVYDGRSGEHEAASRAVKETEGIVITYDGALIPAFYHSSCGGHTEDAFELWGIDAPYLRGVDCDCQEISTYGVWEKRISPVQLRSALMRLGYRINNIRDIGIDGITPAGRVKQVEIRYAGGTAEVPAEKFRAAIGNSLVPSVFFEAGMYGDEIVISGRGRGHGVGLCQWGARQMAREGSDYRAILAHYYPGTKLVKRENH